MLPSAAVVAAMAAIALWDSPPAPSVPTAAKSHHSPRAQSVTASEERERFPEIPTFAGKTSSHPPAVESSKDSATHWRKTARKFARRSLTEALQVACGLSLRGRDATLKALRIALVRERHRNPMDPSLILAARLLLPKAERGPFMAETVEFLAHSDPATAAVWVDAISDRPSRRRAIQSVASTWAGRQTRAAFDWADRIADSAERQQARQAIQSVAPVGVGVAITRDNDSPYPRAMNIIPQSPAGRSGQIQPGDRIVGVADMQSQWVDTRGQDINRVVQMIRGASGQPVQLRVLPAGSTDLANTRVVTIVREQLFFGAN